MPRQQVGARILFVSGPLATIASFLPWLVLGPVSVAGTEDLEGWLASGAGLVLVSTAASRMLAGGRLPKWFAKVVAPISMPALPVGAAWMAWAGGTYVAVSTLIKTRADISECGVGRVGIGLWLRVGAFGVALASLALLGRGQGSRTGRVEPEPGHG
jgi:hypothetical protein